MVESYFGLFYGSKSRKGEETLVPQPIASAEHPTVKQLKSYLGLLKVSL